MSTGTPAVEPVPVRRPRALLAVVAGVGALALAGAAVAALSMTRGGEDAPVAPAAQGPAGIGDEVRLSFGAMSVDAVRRLDGIGSRRLAGATHGIGNFVPQGSAQIQVAVTLANLRKEGRAYGPGQFSLLLGPSRREVRPIAGSVKNGLLQPDAAIEGSLVFVVPRRGQRALLAYRDPGTAAPVTVDLGRLDTAVRESDHPLHLAGRP